MSNATLAGWQPPSGFLKWFTPVEVEDASAGLTACSLPDGRAIALWPSSPAVHFAVVPNMAALQANDVVTAPMIETALTAGFAIHRTSVFTHDDEVYFTALGSTANPSDRYWVRIYKADDPNDPSAGWSLHSQVHAGINYNFIDFGGPTVSGQPLILASGRWVFAWEKAYRDTGLGGFVGRDGRISTSDDGGVTWVERHSFTHHPLGGPAHAADFLTPQMAQAPDGTVVAATQISASDTDTLISTDNGSTWTTPGYTGDEKLLQPFLDNGTDVFAVDGFNGDGKILKLIGTAWTPVASIWPSDLGNFRSTGNGDDGTAVRYIVDSDRLWYFVGPYVGGRRAWHVGYPGARS